MIARSVVGVVPVVLTRTWGGVIDVQNPTETDAGEQTAHRPVCDWAASNQKKKDAIAQLASLSTTMDEMETRSTP